MAGKNEVTLTFAGDSKQLERSLASVSDATKRTEQDIESLGGGFSRLDRVTGTGGRAFGDYGTGLGGVGDRADEVDTRMMGLSDGIQGVTDLMGGNGKLRPHEMAMAFSDLGSAAYNTVIPSLQSVGKATKSAGEFMKGMNTAVAASLVGLVALAAAGVYLAYTQRGASIDTEKTTAALSSQDKATQQSVQATLAYVDGLTGLGGLFDEVLQKTPALADEFIAQAEAAGVDAESLAEMRAKLAEVDETSQFTAESIRGVNDAIRAQSDPTFAALDAMTQLADANRAVDAAALEVIAAQQEFGAGSAEAAEASRALTEAQIAAGQAAFGQEQAMLDLAAQMQETGFSVEDIIAHLQGLANQGLISQGTVDAVSNALRNVPASVETTLYANDLASVDIENVMRNIGQLPREVVVNIRAQADLNRFNASRSLYPAGGGVVPQYLASGGMGGPRGTDTVPAWLTPGEMVLNRGQQQNLFAMIDRGMSGYGSGGGVVVNVHAAGSILSERQLMKMIRDEFARGGFRSVA